MADIIDWLTVLLLLGVFALGFWTLLKAGYTARRFGDGSGKLWIVLVATLAVRATSDGWNFGFGYLIERAWSFALIAITVGGFLAILYGVGFWFGRKRRSKTGILPMK